MSLQTIRFLLILFLIVPFVGLYANDKIRLYKNARIYHAKTESLVIFIDGKLSDEAWKSAKTEVLGSAIEGNGNPYFKTEMRFLCNRDILYFSFKNFEENIGSLARGSLDRDKIPDKEDFIQFHLQNGDNQDLVYRFVFYPSGGLADIKIIKEKDKTEVSVDAEWLAKSLESAVDIGDKFWSVEGKINLTELFGKSADTQPYYSFNVFRQRPQKKWDDLESSSFQAMDIKNFHNPSSMAYLFVQGLRQSLPKDLVEKPIKNDGLFNSLIAVELPITDKIIKIDGDISDVIAGGHATQLKFKALKGDNSKLDNLTEAWILSTKTQFIVAMRCYDKSMDALISKDKMRDEALWSDDSIEIFLKVGGETGQDYYHVSLNANASITDSFKNDVGWNGEGILAASKKTKDYWDIEIAIPYLSLDMTTIRKEFGKPWRFNLTRHRPPHSAGEVMEESAWSPTFSEKSHVPEKFGYLFLELMGAKMNKK